MSKPVKFRLKNGLNATLYPPENAEARRLIEIVRAHAHRQHLYPCSSALTLVNVNVENEQVYLVYWTSQYANHALVKKLKVELNTENRPFWIIYAEEVYTVTEPSYNTLYNAVAQRVKPYLAALIT